MSVASRVTLEGTTVAQYRALGQKINTDIPGGPEGAVSHLCYGKDGDLTVLDVWENEAACQKFLELVKPLAEEIGISLPQPEFYEVFSRPGT